MSLVEKILGLDARRTLDSIGRTIDRPVLVIPISKGSISIGTTSSGVGVRFSQQKNKIALPS